ncbi:MAG TPA: tRNA (guanosine(37)-N1)-methyltransferase TrmD [Bacteroidales bacterium]|jgi:tRNA (guanine37-N1)-methyltransferase|nr:tRNA (guanosine(37)-N1)-methyltransferase TrmD [Bacteroidales bacterium]HOL98114.1 tRNA (guanosine(37)-N1)-methyltransferase TrmD [Bacteroidales bacterium]HOM36223.1 tRNA (guanosine(37)-N1)-methyltransferase TrmD [Bacteroidales bacterium]HPD23754.1 tRNA (guanosine(37)-N1)-methyltransferase TrmD [Bacteroidales bacterium]HRS99768.1 tRNA (guanosine(37)-N1)-methyltransferase TrmD [Bacteroidales bacterium]
MRIDIISVLPEIVNGSLNFSVIKRAIEKGLVEVHVHDLREYGLGKHRQVDDYPFGGEPGMVLRIEPIFEIINKLKSQRNYDKIIYTSPDGKKWDQKIANRFSLFENIMILCGHYKGVDQRVRDYLIDEEYSIGDYVLTGGELPAAVMCDSIIRLIPGAIGDEQSALTDSFQDNLLAPPVYTRPAEFNGWKVPPILLSGNFAEIEKWKDDQSFERTQKLRPDLLK